MQVTQENQMCQEERAGGLVRGQREKEISQTSHRLPNLSWFPLNLTVPILGMVTHSLNSCTDVHPPQGAAAWAEGLRVSEQVRPLCYQISHHGEMWKPKAEQKSS